jgi:hypothetical protein
MEIFAIRAATLTIVTTVRFGIEKIVAVVGFAASLTSGINIPKAILAPILTIGRTVMIVRMMPVVATVTLEPTRIAGTTLATLLTVTIDSILMLHRFATTVTGGIFVIKARFAIIVTISTGVLFVRSGPFVATVTLAPTVTIGTILAVETAVAIDKIVRVGPFAAVLTSVPTVTYGTFLTIEVAVTIDKIGNRVQVVTIGTTGGFNRNRHNRYLSACGGGFGFPCPQYKYTRAGEKVKRNRQSFPMFHL